MTDARELHPTAGSADAPVPHGSAGVNLWGLLWYAGGSIAFLTFVGLGMVWLFHILVSQEVRIKLPAYPLAEEVRQRGPVLPPEPRHSLEGHYLSSGPR